ncbi:NAC domain-containing protein 72-like [Euphorbia lathyris]|uniref:NAC domain-containing protein 72-like n=1 Tax=Euphorbia lathyris TaxID=212925 RepID=UPI00331403FE
MCSLPPGCRFYPSDQQLLCYYLTSKNRTSIESGDARANMNGYHLIKELDLYDYQPFDLPENACYSYGCGARKRHWYCYTELRASKESRGGRRRKAKGGFWRRSGTVRDVVDAGGNVVLGTKGRFVFYLGNSVRQAIRTEWILYEYALIDHVKASYALCRIFVKSHSGNCISENMISSCAEESVSAVRHVGIQHDGFLTPDIIEAKVNHGNSVVRRSYLSRYPERLSTKLDDQAPEGRVSVAKVQFPPGIQSNNKLVRAPELPGVDMLVDAETSEELLSILEGDFIELDDLVD